MGKTNLTEASGITPELMRKLNEQYNSSQLRAAQTKLTNTSRELRNLSSGHKMDRGLISRLGDYLSVEQRELLTQAAQLLESVNSHVEHAKEKRVRDEKAAKRRQEARNARAKQLIAATYPLPLESLDQKLDLLKTVLLFNRIGAYDSFYTTVELNSSVRRDLLTPFSKLIGWTSLTAYRVSCLASLRHQLVEALTDDISYDDGSDVEDRLAALKSKAREERAKAELTAEESETLRLWKEALAVEAVPEVRP
ncbi:hypothetical protein OX90_10875 [Pseudomonas coronafaciens pv. porri]|uniref:DNA-binding protein n=1 Tax=Pseudomonas coronafaciens pv. porri TaxID=83964 RepID=A0ABR5JPU8_9PSED|nr:hypothetical protein [Pseudomonas coronafaciens]KOP51510.1 hypothetical protein OX88_25585 [Pseudomonas coronafaciens pv. porri]KOP59542.1 hypothetical protein OX90_10875 [Pseudomonas coronafaciens pv. porri]KPY16938.1 Uncharacterized protein ALO89_03032 [Pseudomonas coronafaciens pv. porri]KPZ21272.1 Uncharacterized protein ALO38_01969 [Pseudomonas coronafaciens pv. zizaniae]RMN27468.1 hypothetical protein ALQ62_01885 [Pseudomonas coronafaciens pv. zizaniae]